MQENDLKEIVAWLDAGDAADYQAGVLLLQRHAKNRALVAHLLRKESAGNREKLAYELVKAGCGGNMGDVHAVLSQYAQAVQSAVPAPVVPELVAALPEEPAPTDVPEAVRAQVDDMTELLSRLHSQRVQLSNSLAELDPAAASPVVAQILSLQEQYNALAVKRRNLVEQPAAEPGAPGVEVTPEQPTSPPAPDRAALQQQRGNLRSNISKAKGKLEKAQTEAKKAELEEKVAKLQAELGTVDLQLASPQ